MSRTAVIGGRQLSQSERSENTPLIETKVISVSPKRQITIPMKFFDKLGIGAEVECTVRDNELIIRPIRRSSEFSMDTVSEQILEDLVGQGLSGRELVEEFKRLKAQVRPAVERALHEAYETAANIQDSGDNVMNELFGDSEDSDGVED